MFVIEKGLSLKPYNTFGIDVSASYYARANTVEKVRYAINVASYYKLPIHILGAGSNTLLTKNFDGVILNPAMQGIAVMEDLPDSMVMRVGAGVNWDSFVEHCVSRGLGGVENLSNIPGSVGAAPIQNIGAYGAEAKDTIVKVEGIQLDNRRAVEMSGAECRFGYRDSIFKQELKGKFVITHVWFRLSKKPTLQTGYGDLEDELAKLGEKTLKTVRQAVINIRSAKLPDPNVTGNAGSFFKNPTVELSLFNAIKSNHPDVPAYPVSEGLVKIPAAWLIEQCQWKGKRVGSCGVHDKQALVIVNHGGATGGEILELATEIQRSVEQRFAVKLEPEVNVL